MINLDKTFFIFIVIAFLCVLGGIASFLWNGSMLSERGVIEFEEEVAAGKPPSLKRNPHSHSRDKDRWGARGGLFIDM